MLLQESHPSLKESTAPVENSRRQQFAYKVNADYERGTHLLIVSESPQMHRCRFGRVMATNAVSPCTLATWQGSYR